MKQIGEQILAALRAGKKYKEITAELGVSKSTISYWANRYDTKSVHIIERRDDINDDVLVQLRKSGLTLNEIGKRLNAPASTVQRRLWNLGVINIRPQPRGKYLTSKIHRSRVKLAALKYKGNCCELCGEFYHPNIMEFHHLDPDKKDFAIGNFYMQSWSIIRAELDKCILVCANCHRICHLKKDRDFWTEVYNYKGELDIGTIQDIESLI